MIIKNNTQIEKNLTSERNTWQNERLSIQTPTISRGYDRSIVGVQFT